MSQLDSKVIDMAMEVFRDYAERNKLGRPVQIIQAHSNDAPFPDSFGLACIWNEEFRTAVNFGFKYRGEMEEVERRLKAWEERTA